MRFNKLVSFFLPSDKVFYLLFEKVASRLEEMAFQLNKAVNHSDVEKRKEIFQQIHDLEHANDETTHQIFIELSQNFITPFDREDVHTLASNMDDIADFIQGAAKRMNLYNINKIDESISRLCGIILESVSELKKAIYQLKNIKDVNLIKTNCIKINSLENNADDIFDSRIAQLFENEKDAVYIIKMKEILQSLEKTTDRCEDVANVIESIIIKYN